ncbi:hypothetical protein HYV79_04310 [Candidatus Woesearchaeota archaeon]|nr:hypothetical protein [Candidatus Woesearchaeota archaeon]
MQSLIPIILFILLTFTANAVSPACDPGECLQESVFNDVVQQRLEILSYVFVAVVVIVSSASVWNAIKTEKWKKPLTTILIAVVLSFLVYSVLYYKWTGAETEGIFFCNEKGCFWAAHIHASINIKICGEDYDFLLETGDLAGPHTHKERGKIHFHDKIPVDEKRNLLDTTPLTIKTFTKTTGLQFNSTCLGNYCNGDLCPDESIGKVSMNVNGNEELKYENYVWKEGDIIEIKFR